MQIAFHIGANCTDEDRLIKSLLRNADICLKEGIAIPGPGRYRSLIRETIQALGDATPPRGSRDVLVDSIVENDDIERVVMSNGNFMCVPNRIFEDGVLYPNAGPRVRSLRRLFPKDEIALFLGIRNPVSFLQETFRRASATSLPEFLGALPPEDIFWSDMIARVASDAPDIPLTVWCNEDTPLLWDQILRAITGIDEDTHLAGEMDMLETVITDAGLALVQARLQADPQMAPSERHDIIAEVWESHARDDQIEDVIDLPELDPDLIADMTQMYEEDLDRIAEIPGVTLMLPFA